MFAAGGVAAGRRAGGEGAGGEGGQGGKKAPKGRRRERLMDGGGKVVTLRELAGAPPEEDIRGGIRAAVPGEREEYTVRYGKVCRPPSRV